MENRGRKISSDAPEPKEPREQRAQRSFLQNFVRTLAIAAARADHTEEMERRKSKGD